MSAFEYFSVALSFVLGLGLTRLLLGALYVFRARERQRVHWIPILWAASIFLFQIQYWWAVFELRVLIEVWTHGVFITLVALALLLFVAGALVLPASDDHAKDDLMEYFHEDGRWALLAMTAYAALSLWANWYLFGVSPMTWVGLMVIAFGLVSFTAFAASNRRVLSAFTVAFLALSVWAYLVLAPGAYQ